MSSRDLRDACQTLRDAWERIVTLYELDHPGNTLIITCTFRSVEEQEALFAKGRTIPGEIVTQCDGVKIRSNHNVFPSDALDFAVVINGKVSWDVAEYAVVGLLAETEGLVWGGHWSGFSDAPHLEVKG